MKQTEFLLKLEKQMKVNKPIFIDRNRVDWNETEKQTGVKIWDIREDKLVYANAITQEAIIGRYRIDDSNSDGYYELWFDLDANKDLKTKASVRKNWKYLKKAAKKLVDALHWFGITDDHIIVKSSGRGLQFSVFCNGFKDHAQFINTLSAVMEVSKLDMNVKKKESKGVIWGFDSPSTISSRRKVRCFGGQNDKLRDMTHYCSLVCDLDSRSYPFVKDGGKVIYPENIQVFTVTKDFVNRLHEVDTFKLTEGSVQSEGKVSYTRSGAIADLYKCPLVKALGEKSEAEKHLTNPERVFLLQTLGFFGKEGKEELHRIISHCSDYSEAETDKQIRNMISNNRKPITCEWAKKNIMRVRCVDICKGIKHKTPVMLAWKPPKLDDIHEQVTKHVLLNLEDGTKDYDVIDIVLGMAIERSFWPEADPLWFYLIAPSGGGKTELLRMISNWKQVYTIDELTKASLVSGYKPDEGQKGILKDMHMHTVVVKDMSQLLTTNKDDRNAIFGTLRNAYDGTLEKGFGTAEGKISIPAEFGLIIGMTPVIDNYYTLMGQLGERFLKIRFRCDMDTVLDRLFFNSKKEFLARRKKLKRTVNEFLGSLEFREIEPPKDFYPLIKEMVKFTGKLRTALFLTGEGTFATFRGEEEIPSRLMNQIVKLFNVLCAVRSKSTFTEDEMKTIARVLIQTPPIDRMLAIYYMVENRSKGTTINGLADFMQIRHNMAEFLLNELQYLGVVMENDDKTYSMIPYYEKICVSYLEKGWFKWVLRAKNDFIQYRKRANKKKRMNVIDKKGLHDTNWLNKAFCFAESVDVDYICETNQYRKMCYILQLIEKIEFELNNSTKGMYNTHWHFVDKRKIYEILRDVCSFDEAGLAELMMGVVFGCCDTRR